MQCKYCQAELEQNNSRCPHCGRDNAQEVWETAEIPQPKKKVSPAKIIVAAVVGVILLFLLVQVVHKGVTGRYISFANDIYAKVSYTVDAGKLDTAAKLEAQQKKLNQVVATMGDHTLTNRQLQVFFWSVAKNYSYEISFTKPLSEQIYDADAGMSWEQHILEEAIEKWSAYTLLAAEAQAAGFVLPDAYQNQLDSFTENIEEAAASYGYADTASYVEAMVGIGSTVEDYRQYVELYYTAELYLQDMVWEYTATMEEMDAYFAANESSFAQSGITKETEKLLDIRHILIKPEGDTEAAWEACREEAQSILNQWLAGEKTDSSFADLAKQYSDDGSASSGGLYQEVYAGQMVKEFNDWCFAEDRETGDYGLVKTQFGYHVMYYVYGAPAWQYYSRMGVQLEKGDAYADSLVDAAGLKVNYRKIVLSDLK